MKPVLPRGRHNSVSVIVALLPPFAISAVRGKSRLETRSLPGQCTVSAALFLNIFVYLI